MFSKPFIAAYVGFAKCFDVGAVSKRQALLFLESSRLTDLTDVGRLFVDKLSISSSSHMVSCCRDLA